MKGRFQQIVFQIRSLCDVEYRKLNFSAYPVHVKYLKNYAFKPIVIAVGTLVMPIKYLRANPESLEIKEKMQVTEN